MRRQRSGFLFISMALLTLALAGAAEAATKPPKLLKLSVHSSFAGNQPITVRWRTDRVMAKGEAYKVTLSTSGTPERDGPACSTPQIVRRVGAGTPPGRTIVIRFAVPKSGRWCPTRSAGVSVDTSSGPIGSASFAVRDSRGGLPADGVSWGRLTFGPASTITVKVPGRPDRTAPLTAQIDQDTYVNPKNPFGFIGERLFMNSSGTVTPGALTADPLCTSAPIAPLTVDRSTTVQFPGVHTTPLPLEFTLVLRAGAAALTGCAADEPAPAVSAILLKADPNATGPTAPWHVSGSIDGVRLAGGAVASVVLAVDLVGPAPTMPADS